MFVKRKNRNTLALNFDEVEMVEREISSYDHHSHSEETILYGKKSLLLTKPPKKDLRDIDNVVKLVKKLSNEVVDMKKNVGEGSSKPQNCFHFFKRQYIPPKPLNITHMSFNLYSFSNYNFYSYHQQNYPK